jgi:two-component system LytT family response regulator
MKNLTCFIVDDEQVAVEALSTIIRRYCPDLTISGTANSVRDGLELLNSQIVDILFLDIKMKQETGFDLLKQLQIDNLHIIFVTAHDEYGIQAIKFSATDYLLKPIIPEELIAAVYKINHKRKTSAGEIEMLLQSYDHQKNKLQKRIALADQNEIRYVLIENIVCCNADNSYTSFYISNETAPIIVSKSISDYEQILSIYGFLRTHQSWLINKNRIESFKKADGGYLVMDNKMSVPVSRQRRHLLNNNA